MLDQITGLVKNQAMDYMQNSSEEKLTDEQMNGVADAAQESVVGGLKEELMSGNVSGIQGLLTGGAAGMGGNPIVQKIISMFGGSLVSKVGLSTALAGGLSAGMIPKIMGSLGGKFQSQDEGDSAFDVSNIAGLAGGGGIGNMIKGAIGGAGDTAGGLGNMVKDAVGGAGKMGGDAVDGAAGGLGNVADKLGDIAGGLFKK